ncbi:F-box protein At3g07870-like [Apium graveolens]|uniref:F-box protein At3g07870-like n=1 Tax=Apium graveolens TaxID=4045 RepID=UPI003D78BE6C
MMKGTSSITDLHEHIILEILCFLPAKSIIRCTCVCKDWANLIYQPYFPHEYFSRGKAPLHMVLESNHRIVLVQLDESLYTATYPFNFSIPSNSVFDLNIRLRHPRVPSSFIAVCACNYTCWIVALDLYPYVMYHRDKKYKKWPQYHLYNPVTGQHIVVPKPNKCYVVWRNCALIFVRKTNQLKLLEIYDDQRGRAGANMQTIGTKTWRKIEKVPYQDYGRVHPVLLNGQYHWLDCKEILINSLDAEEEVFRVIHTPPSFKNCEVSNLGVLDGCLCLAKLENRESEIWVMNVYGIQDSWTKLFVVSVPSLGPFTRLKNGEFLMLGQSYVYGIEYASAMVCYNPRARHSRYITSDTPDEALKRLRMFS